MARDFLGSNDFLSHAAVVLSTVPFTFACWFNSDDILNNQVLISILDDEAGADDDMELSALGSTSGDPIEAKVSGASTVFARTLTGYIASVWFHACGVFTASNNRTAYIDAGSEATNTDSSGSVSGLTATQLGEGNGGSGDLDGRMAEAAIWNISLTAADVMTLTSAYSPEFVKPGNLKAYWPLWGRHSPEISPYGNFDMTINGTVNQAAHQRVIYPEGAS